MFFCVCLQNYVVNLLLLDDGSLMCVWFGGFQEGKVDIFIWGLWLVFGSDCWSEVVKLCDDLDCLE